MKFPLSVHPLIGSRAVVTVVVALMVLATSRCRAAFMLPPSSFSLAKSVTAACTDASGCRSTLGSEDCYTGQACELECPATSRQDFPDTEIPLKSWAQEGTNVIGCQVSTDTAPTGGPSSADSSNGLMDVNGTTTSSCKVSNSSADTSSGRLAMSFWVLPSCGKNNCTLVNIAPTASSDNITVFLSNNSVCINSFCRNDTISSWTHVILQISDGKADVVVNVASDGPSASVPALTDTVNVIVGTTPNLDAEDSYQLYDVRYYSDVLTFREIQHLYSNQPLTQITPVSNCRCPHTHPTLKKDNYTCENSTHDEKERLERKFYPADKLLDGNDSTKWAGPGSGDFTLTVDLEQTYQVEKVEIKFQERVPSNISVNLPKSQNSVLTCTQLACSFVMHAQNMTPGVFANRVVQTINLTFTQPEPNIIVSSVVVSGWCNCNGNAGTCNTSVIPYECNCNSSTFTQGNQCQSCMPNRFHNTGQFDCQGQCNCEPAGAKRTEQVCDENGGACLCKDNVEGQRCDSCKNWTYAFNASQELDCLGCPCHQNGSVSCDKNNGTCACKANVDGLNCSECNNMFYDVGPAQGPDECRPCGCDSAGVVQDDMVCDKVTGQCNCKDFVQGRTCSECKDGYYSLQKTQPKGCLECQCNGVGSLSKTCDKTNGQCLCENGLPVSFNCVPDVENVTPRYGPLSGGTLVTITGQLLGNASQVPTIFVGSVSQRVIEQNITTVIFKTSKSTSLGSSQMKISWKMEPADTDIGKFTFKADPVLDKTDLPTVSMFTSGGCGVRFKGSNFGSVYAPLIFMRDSSGKTAYGTCRNIKQYLQCIMPDLGHVKNIDVKTLRVGLQFDGVLGNDNLGPVEVRADPRLDNLGSYDFQYPFETTVSITGSGLTGGCNPNEIRVLLGVISCDIVSLSASEIQCEPPQSLHGTKGIVIMVSVGNNIAQQVGTLNYLEFYETSFFIGITCGLVAIILIIIGIIIFCRCRRRNGNATNRDSHIALTEKTSNGNHSTQNQYSELPNVSGGVSNSGFPQTPIRAETVIREPKEVLPPTAREVDLMADFLHRVEPSLREAVKAAVVTTSDLTLGRLCTNKGKYARIIDGQFATERAGQKTQKKVTIKTLTDPLPANGLLPRWAGDALRECLRLHRYNDGSILSIMGLALAEDRFHVIYPFMENRTLKDHIVDAKQEFNVRELVEFGLQVAEGVEFLHSKDLIHRDLATRNCMVNSMKEVKISDASFSWDFYGEEYVYDSDRERYLSVRWMAPESLMNGYYAPYTDVWSLGVMLWELLTRGCLPFHEVDNSQVKEYVVEGYVLGKPQNCSEKLYELMKECWSSQSDHRPTVSTLVKLLGDEITDGGVEQDDIYVNMGTVDGYYENQDAMGKPRRKAPLPPKA